MSFTISNIVSISNVTSLTTLQAVIAAAGPDRAMFVNETISLDGLSSIGAFDGLQPDGRHSIQWDFGYGGWTYEGGLQAPIAYPEVGTYNVTLTIYDEDGNSDSDTTQITVNAITLGSEDTLTDTGNVATNTTNLQAAIDAVVSTNNPVITLPVGFRSNPITLKHRTVANYCTIRTANHASLPDGVSRVAPGDASDMAILETSTNANIITTPTTSSSPARYYNFIGIHLRKTTSTDPYTNSFVNLGFQDETSLDQLVNHIIFDRCYFDGGSTTSDTLRGIIQRASDFSVVNCYFHRFKGVGIEAQAVAVMMGERMAFINNFMEGAGENWITGGADPSIDDHVPTDIVFRRNYCKKDLGWLSTHGSFYGTDMVVKNIFELKLANRCSSQGNIFEDHWLEDQNYAITITPRNQGGLAPWSVIQYFDFSHNKILKFGNGMSLAAEDDLQLVVPTNHVLVRHNVFAGSAFYSGQQITWLLGGGQDNTPPPITGFDKVALVRNSSDSNGDPLGGAGRAIEWDTSINNTNFQLLGNIMQGHVTSGAGSGGSNEAAFQLACSSTSYDVRKNGFYRSKVGAAMPADNSSVSLIADVKYTNLAAFDLSLAGDSPFLTTGLLGGRAGADVAAVNVLTESVVSGIWTPDITAPVISDVSHGTPGDTSATITWGTDDFSDSRVFYDTTSRPGDTDGSTYAFSTALDPALVTSHSVGLSGLSASTTYFYKVRSASTGGVSYSSQESFSTIATPADFVTDSFTVASDENLEDHVGETGADWTLHPSYSAAGVIDAATDRLYATGTTAYYASGTPPGADYYVQGEFYTASVISQNTAICLRMNTTTNDMYLVRFVDGTSWALRKIISGTQTTLDTSTNQLPGVGEVKTVKLSISGSNLSVEINGVEEMTATDSDITAAGKAGIRCAGTGSASTGFHLSNFSAR